MLGRSQRIRATQSATIALGLMGLVVVVVALGTFVPTAHAATAFPASGWTNPTGSSFEDWHFGACDGYYLAGLAHLGADSSGTGSGQVAVALGPGTVTGTASGWPGDAIGIEHVAGDGSRFLGVYGHINREVGIGATVSAGQRIGTLYNQGANSHLHLGVRPLGAGESSGSSMLRGRSACSGGSAPHYGYTNPMPWLAAHGPASAPPPPPPDDDADGVPNSGDTCPLVAGDPLTGCPPTNGIPFDANGDGRTDLVHRWSQGVNTWLSKGDGGYEIRGQQANPGYGYGDGLWFAVEANGDGKTDLVHRWSQGVNTWLSKGDGTYTIRVQQAQPGYGYTDGVWFAADANGDGRTDLVHRWSQGVNTWLSKGDGTYTIRVQQAQPGYGYTNGVWFASDANGDGRTDLVHRWSQGVNTWLSKGDGTYTIRVQQAQPGYGYTNGVWFASDANGDGRTDLVHRWSQGVNTWLSKGDGGYEIRGQGAHAGYGFTDGVWFATDTNGDGRTDLVHRWSQGVNTWLSNGGGGYTIRVQQAQPGYGYTDGVWFASDANGDGRTDLVHRWSQGVNTWLSKGDGGYTVRGQAAHPGYGFTDGQWPASVYSMSLLARPSPSSSRAPVISGSPVVGASVACSQGTWKHAPTTYSYAWLRNDSPIQGQTTPTYKLGDVDGGLRIACRVTAANSAGARSAKSVAIEVAHAPGAAGPPRSVPAAARRCVVPRLRTRTLKAARRALKRRHCRLGRIRKPRRAGRQLVIKRQAPRAGSVRPRGTRVHVTLRPARASKRHGTQQSR